MAQEVPVLSYHQVRDHRESDSRSARVFIVPPARFAAHMKMLHDSGYHVIGPDQLTEHIMKGNPLPSKPVLITFDDGTEPQYTVALPVLKNYRFPAVFFIMTVTLGRPGYLSRQQVKALTTEGMIVGCHTWDHHKVTEYKASDVEIQLLKPKADLEKITGKPVNYFAYPFGVWDDRAIAELKKLGYLAAFQLTGKVKESARQFTIRRIVVDGSWSAKQLDAAIKRTFK
jgi:peptidoglycan/xylan/chitin deacetylase (PgdA/CDA1 family)